MLKLNADQVYGRLVILIITSFFLMALFYTGATGLRRLLWIVFGYNFFVIAIWTLSDKFKAHKNK